MAPYFAKISTLILVSLLAACGGGGGSSDAPEKAPSSGSSLPDSVSSPAPEPTPSPPDTSPDTPETQPDVDEPDPPQAEGIYLLAGSPTEQGHTDGVGEQARFSSIGQLEIDGSDNLYVVDAGAIRRISPSGQVTTLAGMPGEYGYQDGMGETARFGENIGIAVAASGVVYVLDRPYIRRVDSTGAVTTIVDATESGFADGLIENARFHDVRSIEVDDEENVYVEDSGVAGWSSFAARKISPEGVVTTVYTACAELLYQRCFDLEVDAGGTLYFKEQSIPQSAGSEKTAGSPRGIKVDPDGVVSGIIGYPVGMSALTQVTVADIDRNGNMYVYHDKSEGTLYAWYYPWRITRTDRYLKKLSPSGEVTIIEPFTREPGETPPPFANPDGLPLSVYSQPPLAVDSKGVIYYAEGGFIGKVVAAH